MPRDLTYVLLLFVLFVVPRFLQRFRLPTAVSSLGLGVAATALGLFEHDPTVALLATFGIVALFLFAGLDADIDELRPDFPVLLQHLGLWITSLAAVTSGAAVALDLPVRTAALVGLALVTPSTGFILDSLDAFGLSPAEKRWTKSKAITSELLALGGDVRRPAVDLGAADGAEYGGPARAPRRPAAALPLVCRARRAVRATLRVRLHAHGGDGLRLRDPGPRASTTWSAHSSWGWRHGSFGPASPPRPPNGCWAVSRPSPRYSCRSISSRRGWECNGEELGWRALVAGSVLVVGLVALRLGKTTLVRWVALRERPAQSIRIGLALLPTLVFTLVLVDLLRERPEVPATLIGALVVYTILVTLLPGLILRIPPPTMRRRGSILSRPPGRRWRPRPGEPGVGDASGAPARMRS